MTIFDSLNMPTGDGSYTVRNFADIWVQAFNQRYLSADCLRDMNAHAFAFKLRCNEPTFDEYRDYFVETNGTLHESLVSLSKAELHSHLHFSSAHFRDDQWGNFSLHGIILVHPDVVQHFWSAARLVRERYRGMAFSEPDHADSDLMRHWRVFENGVIRSRDEIYDGDAQGVVLNFGPKVESAAQLGGGIAYLQ